MLMLPSACGALLSPIGLPHPIGSVNLLWRAYFPIWCACTLRNIWLWISLSSLRIASYRFMINSDLKSVYLMKAKYVIGWTELPDRKELHLSCGSLSSIRCKFEVRQDCRHYRYASLPANACRNKTWNRTSRSCQSLHSLAHARIRAIQLCS